VSNLEQDLIPELLIICGCPARKLGCAPRQQVTSTISEASWASDFLSFLHSLHESHGFDFPPLDVFVGSSLLHEMSRVIDVGDSGVIEFDSISECVRVMDQLEALNMILRDLDSPRFAMWCGSQKSQARELLLVVQSRVQSTLDALRSAKCSLHSVIPADPISVKQGKKDLKKASLLGLRVDTLQLVGGSKVSAKQMNSWARKLVSAGAGLVWLRSGYKPTKLAAMRNVDHSTGFVVKPGTLMEIATREFLYAIDYPGAKKNDLNIGIYENNLVVQLDGVRRFIQLPAACSRMQAHNCTLSSSHIAVYFTVKEELWPTQ
jgi:hypothetical protein